jgi:hypothetical protein
MLASSCHILWRGCGKSNTCPILIGIDYRHVSDYAWGNEIINESSLPSHFYTPGICGLCWKCRLWWAQKAKHFQLCKGKLTGIQVWPSPLRTQSVLTFIESVTVVSQLEHLRPSGWDQTTKWAVTATIVGKSRNLGEGREKIIPCRTSWHRYVRLRWQPPVTPLDVSLQHQAAYLYSPTWKAMKAKKIGPKKL